MAVRVNNPTGFGMAWLLSVSESVGWGRSNRRPDVLLVQYIVNALIDKFGLHGENQAPSGSDPVGGAVYPRMAPLVLDGTFGPATAAGIGAYQASASARYVVKADQVVDPMPSLGSQNPMDPTYMKAYIAYSRRTIFYMNTDYLAGYQHMIVLSDLPSEVQADIKMHDAIDNRR